MKVTLTYHHEFDNGHTVDYDCEMVSVQCTSPYCYHEILLEPCELKARQLDGRTFWCKNGHENSFPARSDVEIARIHERYYALCESRQSDQAEIERLHRVVAGLRGTITRLKREVPNGAK